jgi:Tol biopolymer transport system component
VVLSPAATAVAVFRKDRLRVIGVDDGAVRSDVGPVPERAVTPAWGPDGRVAYTTWKGRPLVVVDPATGHVERHLAPDAGRILGDVVWSPDGTQMSLVTIGVQRGARRVLVVPAGADAPSASVGLPAGIAPSTPQWSPDGRMVAVSGITIGTTTTRVAIYAFDVAAPFLRRITPLDDRLRLLGAWSPDGTALAYTAIDPPTRLPAAPRSCTIRDPYTVDGTPSSATILDLRVTGRGRGAVSCPQARRVVAGYARRGRHALLGWTCATTRRASGYADVTCRRRTVAVRFLV